jgi:hypothetical protein
LIPTAESSLSFYMVSLIDPKMEKEEDRLIEQFKMAIKPNMKNK